MVEGLPEFLSVGHITFQSGMPSCFTHWMGQCDRMTAEAIASVTRQLLDSSDEAIASNRARVFCHSVLLLLRLGITCPPLPTHYLPSTIGWKVSSCSRKLLSEYRKIISRNWFTFLILLGYLSSSAIREISKITAIFEKKYFLQNLKNISSF